MYLRTNTEEYATGKAATRAFAYEQGGEKKLNGHYCVSIQQQQQCKTKAHLFVVIYTVVSMHL